LRINWLAKRICYAIGAIWSAKNFKRSLATIGNWQFDAFMPVFPTRMTNGGSNLSRRCGSSKFIDGCKYTHAS
jgi:hypothetical protein